MKRILILIIGLFGVAQAQFAPTSAKTAFKNGISIGTKDSTAYATNDSLVVVINRQGRMMYRSTDGYWKLLANAASSDYVPYTGAVTNVNLGNFRLTARSLRTDSIYSNSSAGMYLLTNGGAAVAHWGGGGSVEVDFKGFAGYDANRSASYTTRSFTDKGYVDSADALRVKYTDTAAMLLPYLRKSDTATMLAPFVQYSDTANMLSPYRRTTTKITNSDLVNSTISGIALGSNLNNLSAGNGLSGTAYNGSAAQSWRVDTSTISTKANVTGLLVGYATTGSVATKLNISDTASMLSNYRRKTTLIENADLRNSAITINGSSTALGGSISVGTVTSVAASAGTGISVSGSPITGSGTLTITNTAPDQTVTLTAGSGISVSGTYPNFTITNSSPSSGGTVTSVSAGTGMSFTTITSTGAVNADTTVLATRAYAAGLDVAKANTSLNNVNGVLSSTYGGAGSVSGILKANGSGTVSAAVAGTDYVAGSSISGTTNYIPKFTSSTAIGNSIIQEANGSIGVSITPSAWAGGYVAIENLLYNASYSNNGGLAGIAFNAYHNGTNWVYRNTTNANRFESTLDQFKWFTAPSGTAGTAITFTERMNLSASQLTLTVPLNGTSLSMSGAGSVSGGFTASNAASDLQLLLGSGVRDIFMSGATAAGTSQMIGLSNIGGSNRLSLYGGLGYIASDGTFLINTTTTDGTNKLIVNGGVKASVSGQALTLTSSSDIYARVERGASYTNIGVDATGSFYNTNTNHRFLTQEGAITALTIASTGAATFSSSVTGTILTGNSYVVGGYLQASGTTGLLVLTTADWGANSEIRNNTTINGANGGDYLSFKNPTGKGFSWTVNGSSVASLSSGGAATFSSSITASEGLFGGAVTNGTDKLRVSGNTSTSQLITGSFNPNMILRNTATTLSSLYTTVIAQGGSNYTYTLDAASGHNRIYIIRAYSSGTSITLNRSGSDVIVDNAGNNQTSLTITPSGGAVWVQSNGSDAYIQLK